MFLKKHLFKLIIILSILLTVSLFTLRAQILGDVNQDNSINIVDALMIAQYYVGFNPSPFDSSQADTNCDNNINIVDALVVAQYYVGKIAAPTCSSAANPPTATPAATPATPDPGTESVSCAGYPVWNSNTVYDAGGYFVQYNCNLYRSNYFTFDDNPVEVYVNQYSIWVLQGACNNECRMGEGPWTACGQWDNWEVGDYTIWNNIWGDGAGEQCIWVESPSNWGVTANHPNTGGVKSYPNVSIHIDQNLNSIGRLSSSFDVSVPNGGSYATTYDIWANSHAYEIMVWVNQQGEVGPIAGSWTDEGVPVPEATNVSIGGHTWNAYFGNIGFDVISFVRTSNINSGSIDLLALLDYAQSQGWYSNPMIEDVGFGYEITSSSGGMDFTCNSYSLSF